MNRTFRALFLSAALCATQIARAGVAVTVDAPGIQASQIAGVTTETFDGFNPSYPYSTYTSLTTAIGTLSSPYPGLAIVDTSASIFGGAGGIGEYFAIGVGVSPLATLTLNGPQTYFGFWWSAADQYNGVQLLSGNQVIASFNPTTALGALTDPLYYGNPNSGADAGEKFAYVNFFGTGGTTFDQILFSNPGNASDFEADNFSVYASQLAPTGSPIDGGVTNVTPEPSTLALFGTAITSMGLLRWRRQTTRRPARVEADRVSSAQS